MYPSNCRSPFAVTSLKLVCETNLSFNFSVKVELSVGCMMEALFSKNETDTLSVPGGIDAPVNE
jgi:hypothetical protein